MPGLPYLCPGAYHKRQTFLMSVGLQVGRKAGRQASNTVLKNRTISSPSCLELVGGKTLGACGVNVCQMDTGYTCGEWHPFIHPSTMQACRKHLILGGTGGVVWVCKRSREVCVCARAQEVMEGVCVS